MGARDIVGRIVSSVYQHQAPSPTFTPCHDVAFGGVLLALPALLAVGLLAGIEKYFQLPRGFYRLDTIFLLLAFMALARLKTMEDLRYCAPGEWGKLLGVDRAPEVKTLRGKVGILSLDGLPREWQGELARLWMETEPDVAGVLYLDGHVRVYHGSQTQLPRHYVSRQKLCLQATVDYWVNAMDGRPFFVVNKAVDPGLQQVLEDEIIPRLEQDLPSQPRQLPLEQSPCHHRFTMVFDREGYSPALLERLRDRGIACLTYRKFSDDDWPEAEFKTHRVTLANGNVVDMLLAERGVRFDQVFWLREIRRLTSRKHQTAILATDYTSAPEVLASRMFARWSQENFFGYMRQHFNLDRLANYDTEEVDETTRVVSPLYRDADGAVRKAVAELHRKQQQFAALQLSDTLTPRQVEAYQAKKAEMWENILQLEETVTELKACRKATPKHVLLKDLPPEDRFQQLDTRGKYFLDTIKMIAYRAETAMAVLAREKMSRRDDARALLRGIYATEADIVPDDSAGTLTIRLHQPANRSSADVIRHICDVMNSTKTSFPGSELRLVYELVS